LNFYIVLKVVCVFARVHSVIYATNAVRISMSLTSVLRWLTSWVSLNTGTAATAYKLAI